MTACAYYESISDEDAGGREKQVANAPKRSESASIACQKLQASSEGLDNLSGADPQRRGAETVGTPPGVWDSCGFRSPKFF